MHTQALKNALNDYQAIAATVIARRQKAVEDLPLPSHQFMRTLSSLITLYSYTSKTSDRLGRVALIPIAIARGQRAR